MSIPKPLTCCFAACLLSVFAAISAQADSITFGSPGSFQYVTGTITAGTGTVTITLNNMLTNNQVTSISQNISGIYFTVTGYGGSAGIVSSNAQYLTTLVSGQPTSVMGAVPTNWAVVNNIAGGLGVCVICPGTNAPAGPAYTIIGGVPTMSYVNANGSLSSNKPHNPFLAGTVTFTLDVPGVNAGSTFSNTLLQFGTAATPPTQMPESDALLTVCLSGASVFAGLLIRRRV